LSSRLIANKIFLGNASVARIHVNSIFQITSSWQNRDMVSSNLLHTQKGIKKCQYPQKLGLKLIFEILPNNYLSFNYSVDLALKCSWAGII